MTIDRGRTLLEAFKQTLSDEFDRDLIEAYAKNLDYDDLDRTFRDQLAEEMSHKDET